MYFFTSVTANYLPKARVLASSVKKFHPEACFFLMISDRLPRDFDLNEEPFDSVIQISDLGISNIESWIFKHSLVELCTAVKGFAFKYLFNKMNARKVIYLDPDIVVFSDLNSVSKRLDQYSILLTPHQTVPEKNEQTIIDNEICSLKHGVFNLGFLAVNSSDEGRLFVDWWSDRLEKFCYDDIPGGLFTDQRWIDLAPCFFEKLFVMREPVYNVCTWNLSNRVVTGSFENGIYVNGHPLCFYHFSGFDSGAQEIMLNKYGKQSPFLYDLRKWYLRECDLAGQQSLGKVSCFYDFFDNGQPITRQHRLLYRSRQDLVDYFPNPYLTSDKKKSYYAWYLANAQGESSCDFPVESATPEMLRNALVAARSELSIIKNSRSWRVVRFATKYLRPFFG